MKKLKKYFLIQGILTTLLNQAFADPMSTSASTDFYYTIGTGLLPEVKFGEYTLKKQTPWFAKNDIGYYEKDQVLPRQAFKSLLLIIGCGYKIFPRFKIEAVYFKPLIDKLHINVEAMADCSTASAKRENTISTQEYSINVLQLRSRIDLINIKNSFAFYITGGIGGSLIFMQDYIRSAAKSSADVSQDTQFQRLNKEMHSYLPWEFFHSWNWMIGPGISINLAEDINMDISLEYNYLGKLPAYQSEINKSNVSDPIIPSSQPEQILKTWAVVIKLVYDI